MWYIHTKVKVSLIALDLFPQPMETSIIIIMNTQN
jgi:hypothetical protein